MTTCSTCGGLLNRPTCILCMTDEVELWLEQKRMSLLKDFRQVIRAYMPRIKQPHNRLSCSVCRTISEYPTCRPCFQNIVCVWLAGRSQHLATAFNAANLTEINARI